MASDAAFGERLPRMGPVGQLDPFLPAGEDDGMFPHHVPGPYRMDADLSASGPDVTLAAVDQLIGVGHPGHDLGGPLGRPEGASFF